ncbi:cell wall metabolism sensor histidine kinase WalK [Pedobacter sp. MC2016-14]|uniref:sensor histidine kinase n=1 Tax=Pedobacter sp. MC2016-14 TaxID=2897327 RepID=UPI001E30A45E|nr:ATP-binding protein [Pedobacter sp. MC2016-14]MCD0489554.1 cell wall metabolism sensor histidine kinase WalK [Pedobacter sp. MC2016-14]
MKIKTKLRLGFGFLFAVVLFFGAISLFYLNEISGSARVILKDNYKSLKYTAEMRTLLDQNDLPLADTVKSAFEKQMRLEALNVTEDGEQASVTRLKNAYQVVVSKPASQIIEQNAVREIRSVLSNIEQINLNAIARKNAKAQAAVEKATLYLIFAASISFLILFSFIVNFPGFVANPLHEFIMAIKEVSRKNYKQRLEFHNNDEFSELAEAFNAMTALLAEWENSNLAELKSEKLRIEAIIEQMDDAIIGINHKQEVLFLNKVAAGLLNLNKNDVLGKNSKELGLKNDLLKRILETTDHSNPLKIYADHKDSYFQLDSKEIVIPNFDRQEQSVLIAATKSAGTVYVLKNITEFKELDEAKTNFIATVSHELKTPLASIKMSLKLLSDNRVGEVNQEQRQLLEHIKEDSDRLLGITGELLNLAQVETGNLQLNFVRTNPLKIAVYAMDAVRFQAEQKSILLELICRNDLPDVNADIEKTAWVMINFLSNALRYSPAKSKVIVQIVELDGNIEFSVRDFGKGIDEQYRERLFDRYFQVPTDGYNKSGSGLGLAISKDFITAENGKIWVESEIGVGSRFCFLLPAF